VPRPETIYLFALACAGLVLRPGPALIFIVTRGVVHSRRLAQTNDVVRTAAADATATNDDIAALARWDGDTY